MGASRDTKCTKINHRIQYSSVLCDITGLIKGRICNVSTSYFSIQAPRSDLTREEMVSDPKQSSCYTSSIVKECWPLKKKDFLVFLSSACFSSVILIPTCYISKLHQGSGAFYVSSCILLSK